MAMGAAGANGLGAECHKLGLESWKVLWNRLSVVKDNSDQDLLFSFSNTIQFLSV